MVLFVAATAWLDVVRSRSSRTSSPFLQSSSVPPDKSSRLAASVPTEPTASPATEALPSPPPSMEDQPSLLAAKQPASVADGIIGRMLSVDSTQFADRGYAGFTLGDSYDSLKHSLNRPDEANREEVWLVTKDGVQLFLRKDRLVGVMKLYNSTVRDSSDALAERFGKAPRDRITEFASVIRFGGKRHTGNQILIRYCFPHCIVYGYISSGDVGPFMLVSVFERKYLEDVLRRDIQQK
jgi:hypothetical protein